jgi:hypothetical protein
MYDLEEMTEQIREELDGKLIISSPIRRYIHQSSGLVAIVWGAKHQFS